MCALNDLKITQVLFCFYFFFFFFFESCGFGFWAHISQHCSVVNFALIALLLLNSTLLPKSHVKSYNIQLYIFVCALHSYFQFYRLSHRRFLLVSNIPIHGVDTLAIVRLFTLIEGNTGETNRQLT